MHQDQIMPMESSNMISIMKKTAINSSRPASIPTVMTAYAMLLSVLIEPSVILWQLSKDRAATLLKKAAITVPA